MELNQGQKAAVERIVEFFGGQRPAAYGLTLIGQGGTGKTTCVMTAVEQLLARGKRVLITAPTNKAVKQLVMSAQAHGLDMSAVTFNTVHRALGLAMLPSEDKKHAFRAGKGCLDAFDVMVLDEGSMLSKYVLYDYLIPECATLGIRLLVMGDDMQLPPVKEQVSPVFTEFETIRLTRVERQAEGSEILTVNGILRQAMKDSKPFVAPVVQGNGIQEILPAQFVSAVTEAFTLDTDLDSQRVLAWTNRRVDFLNSAIRQKLYGRKPDRFYPGERVVTGGPVKRNDEVILGTDEECTVVQYRITEVMDETDGEEYKVYQVILQPLFTNGGRVVVSVLHEDEEDRVEAKLAKMSRMARGSTAESGKIWKQFWAFKDMFANIRYCYCITVHRSQGSTYDRVFVDVKDILGNTVRSERQRLLYVAYSRPRHTLYTNKANYVA